MRNTAPMGNLSLRGVGVRTSTVLGTAAARITSTCTRRHQTLKATVAQVSAASALFLTLDCSTSTSNGLKAQLETRHPCTTEETCLELTRSALAILSECSAHHSSDPGNVTNCSEERSLVLRSRVVSYEQLSPKLLDNCRKGPSSAPCSRLHDLAAAANRFEDAASICEIVRGRKEEPPWCGSRSATNYSYRGNNDTTGDGTSDSTPISRAVPERSAVTREWDAIKDTDADALCGAFLKWQYCCNNLLVRRKCDTFSREHSTRGAYHFCNILYVEQVCPNVFSDAVESGALTLCKHTSDSFLISSGLSRLYPHQSSGIEYRAVLQVAGIVRDPARQGLLTTLRSSIANDTEAGGSERHLPPGVVEELKRVQGVLPDYCGL